MSEPNDPPAPAPRDDANSNKQQNLDSVVIHSAVIESLTIRDTNLVGQIPSALSGPASKTFDAKKYEEARRNRDKVLGLGNLDPSTDWRRFAAWFADTRLWPILLTAAPFALLATDGVFELDEAGLAIRVIAIIVSLLMGAAAGSALRSLQTGRSQRLHLLRLLDFDAKLFDKAGNPVVGPELKADRRRELLREARENSKTRRSHFMAISVVSVCIAAFLCFLVVATTWHRESMCTSRTPASVPANPPASVAADVRTDFCRSVLLRDGNDSPTTKPTTSTATTVSSPPSSTP